MSILEKAKHLRLKSMNRGNPIYLDNRGLVLLPVFKCGYTSTHAAYSQEGKVLASFNDLIDYEGIEKITLVRNPYARIVSLYTCQNNRDGLHQFSDSFERFLENVKILLDAGFTDGHYNTLVSNLCIQGKFMPDKVFKMEDLQEYVEYIGLPFAKKNESKNKKPWQSYYTEKAKSLVEEIYAEDIDMFGYSYD